MTFLREYFLSLILSVSDRKKEQLSKHIDDGISLQRKYTHTHRANRHVFFCNKIKRKFLFKAPAL